MSTIATGNNDTSGFYMHDFLKLESSTILILQFGVVLVKRQKKVCGPIHTTLKGFTFTKIYYRGDVLK